jgi:peptidylprolyl isomerase
LRTFTRTGLTIAMVVALTGSLAACTTAESDDAAACTPTESGSASDGVEVTGDFGSKPTVVIDDPLTTEATERTVDIEGDGKVAEEGDTVTVDFMLFNATSGEQVAGTEYTDGSTTTFGVDDTQYLAGIVKTLECSTVGSRVVGVVPPADSWGDTGATDLGVEATDSIVLVMDVVDVETPVTTDETLPKADGADQPLPEGFPAVTVTLAEDGTPTITLPGGDAPTELQVATLKEGDGPVVGEGADVQVKYVGMKWSDGTIFDASTWSEDAVSFNTAQVISGFTSALEGATVGSQVLVIIPPALGYGEASADNTNDLAGETLVFVVDILGLG